MNTTQLLAQITPGVYEYLSACPAGCKGRRYRLHRPIISVPSYQQQVLVEALDGPDAGGWYCMSLANFAIRYRLVETEATPCVNETS